MIFKIINSVLKFFINILEGKKLKDNKPYTNKVDEGAASFVKKIKDSEGDTETETYTEDINNRAQEEGVEIIEPLTKLEPKVMKNAMNAAFDKFRSYAVTFKEIQSSVIKTAMQAATKVVTTMRIADRDKGDRKHGGGQAR